MKDQLASFCLLDRNIGKPEKERHKAASISLACIRDCGTPTFSFFLLPSHSFPPSLLPPISFLRQGLHTIALTVLDHIMY